MVARGGLLGSSSWDALFVLQPGTHAPWGPAAAGVSAGPPETEGAPPSAERWPTRKPRRSPPAEGAEEPEAEGHGIGTPQASARENGLGLASRVNARGAELVAKWPERNECSPQDLENLVEQVISAFKRQQFSLWPSRLVLSQSTRYTTRHGRALRDSTCSEQRR